MDWQVRVDPDLLHRFDRVVIGRALAGDEVEYVVGFDGGVAVVERCPSGVVAPESAVLSFPRGIVQALAEFLKPGPDSAEVGRLEEALRLERSRVEKIIDRAVRD